jgi:hypothetical protein
LLDTNSELVNTFKAYDDMLEQSALQNAKSASTNIDVNLELSAPEVFIHFFLQYFFLDYFTYFTFQKQNETLIDFNTPTREYPPSHTGYVYR